MIEPPPSLNNGSAFCTVNKSPFKLTLIILSKWDSVIDPNGQFQRYRRLRRGHRSGPSAASPSRIAGQDLLDLRRRPEHR